MEANKLTRRPTDLSEAPRSPRRLALHIPNAYPRRLSPLSSPLLTEEPEQLPQQGDLEQRFIRRDGSRYSIMVPRSAELQRAPSKPNFLRARTTDADTARDMLARERNFFVWLRLSTLLAVLAGSLLLQLRLPDDQVADDGLLVFTSRLLSFKPGHPVATLPRSSLFFGVLFLCLSLLSLTTGLVDYLITERHLEKEIVSFDETEGDGSPLMVHAVIVVVGLSIASSAIWLLVT